MFIFTGFAAEDWGDRRCQGAADRRTRLAGGQEGDPGLLGV